MATPRWEERDDGFLLNLADDLILAEVVKYWDGKKSVYAVYFNDSLMTQRATVKAAQHAAESLLAEKLEQASAELEKMRKAYG